jgi:hypothetical protein
MRTMVLAASLVVLACAATLPDASAATSKACRQCRTLCREDLEACANADPRLADCPAKRQASCLRRATRACKKNMKTCCRRTCKETGLPTCCGSAVSSFPTTTLFGSSTTIGSTTTTPGASTTSTTAAVPCTTDDDCATCGCCNLSTHTCGGADGGGGGYCCNLAQGPSTPLVPQGVCGPKSPAICPQEATCAPPGQQFGGTQYVCQFCAGSGHIIEQFIPSGTQPDGYPSNACTRR